MLTQVHTYTYTENDPKRIRTIRNWKVFEKEGKKYLAGIIVMSDNERPLAEGANCRITTTSAIISIEGKVIKTESGSTYFLQGPESF